MVIITYLGSVMPLKNPTCFPNLSDQGDSVATQPQKGGCSLMISQIILQEQYF